MKTLTQWELENGYVKDKDFYRPACAIKQNGEFMQIGGIIHSFPYSVAYEVLEHLQAVSDDIFTIGIYTHIPKPLSQLDPDSQQAINNYLDDPFIKAVQHG